MQKKLLRVSVSVLMGSLFTPYAQAMDFPDQLPQHLNFAKARFTLREDIGGLYRIATPSLMSSDDNTKIQVAIKIREAYWHWQTHPELNKYMSDFQFIARGVMQGVSPETEQTIKSILDFLNLNTFLENTQNLTPHSFSTSERRVPKNLVPHFTDKSQNVPQQLLMSSVTFQKEKVIVAPKTLPQSDETSLEKQIKSTLSSESLDIINPLFELYKKLHEQYHFEKFQTNIWVMYRDIPTTLYPTLEEYLKKLTACLEDVLSSPNNAKFKTALTSKKQNLRNFYNSIKAKKTPQRKRARATGDDASPRQKIRRVSEATPMEEEGGPK